MSDPAKVFISYSHKDKRLVEKLEVYLTVLQGEGIITLLDSHRTDPGIPFDEEIEKNLSIAQIILLMVSVDFLASRYCGIECERAMQRRKREGIRVIPVILRPCDWKGTSFCNQQALPIEGKAIVQWGNRDQAFLNVTEGVKRVAERLRNPTLIDRFLKLIRFVPAVKYALLLAVTAAAVTIVASFIGRGPSQAYLDPKPTPSIAPSPRPSADASAVPVNPQIVVTERPPYDPTGDRDSTGSIAGRVSGVRPEDYRIVIYSLTLLGTWYVQPEAANSKTPIDPDGSWHAVIHGGMRYAVLLVRPDFKAPATSPESPTHLSGVIKAEEIEGKR